MTLQTSPVDLKLAMPEVFTFRPPLPSLSRLRRIEVKGSFSVSELCKMYKLQYPTCSSVFSTFLTPKKWKKLPLTERAV
jgi:hypothetical protein